MNMNPMIWWKHQTFFPHLKMAMGHVHFIKYLPELFTCNIAKELLGYASDKDHCVFRNGKIRKFWSLLVFEVSSLMQVLFREEGVINMHSIES